jgi:hypothetical protein
MQELLVGGKGGRIHIRHQRHRPVAGHQVLHDRNRLDHDDLSVLDRRYERGGVDGEKLRVVLDAGQKVHRPQPIR